ncbi:MAG: hypothetical protein K2K82_06085 [Muribaculaceae bacterium]|nr:hypothetical protein [Muribaculaceae bacterium]
MLKPKNLNRCWSVISIIFLLFFAPSNIFAKSGKYNSFWIEHNVKHNGKNAIKIHYEYEVHGMKDLEGYNSLWIKGPDGQWRKIKSYSYNPGYEDAYYTDMSKIIYVDDLALSPGKHDYALCLTLSDDRGQKLAESDDQTFTGTYTSNQQANHSNNNENNVVRKWRENTYGGMFTIHTEYSNGSKQETMYMSCSLCHGIGKCGTCLGNGVCNWCGGRGMYYWSYSGWQRCGICSGTGRCSVCKGSGKCTCSNTEYPGYQIGGIIFKDNQDNVVNSANLVNNGNLGNNSGSSSGQSSDRTCPGCHGTGKDGDEIVYRTDYTGKQADEYCSQCGKWASPHSHRQKMCRVCNGRGTIR